jgi:type IV secretion system protein VirD4
MSTDFGLPFAFTFKDGKFQRYREPRHGMTFGPTRSGKNTTLITPVCAEVPHSLVVVDPKGQAAAMTARRRREMGQDVYVLNPFGLQSGPPWNLPRHRYNPFARLRIDDPDIFSKVGSIAHALIVTEGREPYFDNTARSFFSTTSLHAIATYGSKATLGMVRQMITEIAARGPKAAELLTAMSKSPYPFIRQPIGRFRDVEARDISSAINSCLTQTDFLDAPVFSHPDRGTLSGDDFSFAQLKKKPTTVYLILPGHLIEHYNRFLRLAITSAIDECIAEPGGHPVLMLLDEFARMQQIPAVTAAFGFAAGFNLQLWPFLQDLPQLQTLYGNNWKSMLANCGFAQFFTPVDMETAEYLQRRGGLTTDITRSRTYGGFWKSERSESRSETRLPLLPPEKTLSLPPDKSIVFFAGRHDPLIAERLAGMSDPDPYFVS